MHRIVKKEQLSDIITKFVIEAPLIAKKRKAGNFVILRLMEGGERIPITIADSDPKLGTVTIIVQAVGKTTKQLCSFNEGEYILDFVGPLGEPTPIKNFGRVICIGGGVGTAEVYPIGKALKDAGNEVIGIVGARTKSLIILEKEMSKVCNTLYITTDDGSYKRKGFVSDQLQDIINSGVKIDGVYAIGPIPMMKVCANVTKPYGIKTYVSLNPIMVDGTGMCGCCRVTVGGRMKFTCVDGPEFDAHEVDFDELTMRNRTYVDLEKVSDQMYEQHICKLEVVK
ncbi:MAG: sulfide/dihydroorotate dehydrogenase-like FAD/NAD-binding protein [Bacteroidetes bacterium]|nr:sulfide/dihydroorotate dehydrogenase-like FAD/NAD-binding protein [Bacteroidota bacterium]MBU1422612.1 sulfide/dihydroorotate dehydrogenase-like FAD/NAD-binding protein [Bacteroidota bacterium]MBU2637250.1 sulfide/dihydroorotate dehydrogenase-like FAD/NAD-binding protein [Bacteroidota bacterium]